MENNTITHVQLKVEGKEIHAYAVNSIDNTFIKLTVERNHIKDVPLLAPAILFVYKGFTDLLVNEGIVDIVKAEDDEPIHIVTLTKDAYDIFEKEGEIAFRVNQVEGVVRQ